MIHDIISQDQFIDLLEEAKKHDLSESFDFKKYSSVFASKVLWDKYIDFKDEYSDRIGWKEIEYSVYYLLLALETALQNEKPENTVINFSIREIPRDGQRAQYETVELQAIKTINHDANFIINLVLKD